MNDKIVEYRKKRKLTKKADYEKCAAHSWLNAFFMAVLGIIAFMFLSPEYALVPVIAMGWFLSETRYWDTLVHLE